MTCRSQTNQMFFFTAAHQHLSYAARTNMKKIAAWIFVFIPHVQRDRYEHVCCYHWATQEKEKKTQKYLVFAANSFRVANAVGVIGVALEDLLHKKRIACFSGVR